MSNSSGDKQQSLAELVIDKDITSLQKHTQHDIQQYRDKNGSSLLHYAAGCDDIEICKYLLQLNMNANIQSTNNQRTPLHWAARNGHLEICKLLVIDHKVSVDTLAKGDVTPLELSIWQCHLTTAIYLVEGLGANPHHPNSWGCTTAHWLGKSPMNDVELVRQTCDWLFIQCKVEYNSPNNHGQTPLHKAAYAGNLTVVQYLVEQFGVVDDIRDNHGNTAADCAERSQNNEFAKWIRRYASMEVHDAIKVLGLQREKQSISSPSLQMIREAYLQLAKVHHPDVSSSNSMKQWNIILDAYQLLQSYWDSDIELFDCQIRILSRNAKLMEHERICWYDNWHNEHEQQQQSLEENNNINTDLAEFQSRLVRLLSSKSLTESGLCLAQLPKEYEKNYQEKVPNPKDYGYRKLIQLLLRECPNINVTVDADTKQAFLRVASTDKTI